MKQQLKFTILIWLLATVWLYAHEPNRAYFKITEQKDYIELQADFPWTLRNALLLNDPSLELGASKQDYKQALFNYLQSHLILKDVQGNVIPLLEVYEEEHEDHNHQMRFTIRYQGEHWAEIENKIMFNLYDNQVNYHEYHDKEENQHFETTPSTADYHRPKKQVLSFWYLGMLIVIVPLLRYYQKK